MRWLRSRVRDDDGSGAGEYPDEDSDSSSDSPVGYSYSKEGLKAELENVGVVLVDLRTRVNHSDKLLSRVGTELDILKSLLESTTVDKYTVKGHTGSQKNRMGEFIRFGERNGSPVYISMKVKQMDLSDAPSQALFRGTNGHWYIGSISNLKDKTKNAGGFMSDTCDYTTPQEAKWKIYSNGKWSLATHLTIE